MLRTSCFKVYPRAAPGEAWIQEGTVLPGLPASRSFQSPRGCALLGAIGAQPGGFLGVGLRGLWRTECSAFFERFFQVSHAEYLLDLLGKVGLRKDPQGNAKQRQMQGSRKIALLPGTATRKGPKLHFL